MARLRIRRTWLLLGLVLLIAATACAFVWRGPAKVVESAPAMAPATTTIAKPESQSIELSTRVAQLGGARTTLASEPTRSRKLELRGSLAYDPGRLVHVHTRFPGNIVEIGTIDDPNAGPSGTGSQQRTLRYTDHVARGQRLAVLWSQVLGEKKSELVDAQAKLKLHEQTLNRLKEYSAAISERALRDAATAVDLDVIAVSKAERTLRSWSLSNDEIAKVKAEAEQIHKRQTEDTQQDVDWARVDIISPIDGTIVEMNATAGDIVDTSNDLFKIADLSVLSVTLHVVEEDLHYLQRLPRPIRAEIQLPANPELGVIEGTIDRIGDTIDPSEHMALLFGSVANPHDTLKVGQFVTASIDIGNEQNVVEVPATALVDDGNDSFIFVQSDPNVPRFTCRKVQVVRRHQDVVYLRRHVNEAERALGLQDVDVGERVVARGALELKSALADQNSDDGAP